MLHTRHTPGCEGEEKVWLRATDRNRRVSADKFSYLRCESCGLIRLGNVPENLGDYYPADYYDLPSLERLAAIANADRFKIETVTRFATPGRLLEVGPAWGVFAYQAKQAGFMVDVIEMDARCCDYLNNVVGVNALQGTLPHELIPAMGRHEVIALWHVVEHLSDPWELIAAAANNLVHGGILVLAAPNPDAWQFHVMGGSWPHLDAPRHLYLLPAEAVTAYASRLGLERIHYTTVDSDSRSWNRFGWQRLLMNCVRGKWLQRAAFVAGYLLSIVLAPLESRDPRGSAYTLVFRKAVK